MKFFQTKEFIELQEKWYSKLKETGFDDIEPKGKVRRVINPRTIAFDNKEKITEFFDKVNTYLNEVKIPPLHRQILSLYAQGMRFKGPKGMIHKVKRSDRVVRGIVKKYKLLILKY